MQYLKNTTLQRQVTFARLQYCSPFLGKYNYVKIKYTTIIHELNYGI